MNGDLTSMLARPGLEPRTRLLVLAELAIGPADWARFETVARAARALPLPRADVEETLLQATLFFGFPRAVTAFEQLAALWPAASPPGGGDVPEAERRRCGEALFAAIYGRNADAVRARLLSFHRAFDDFVVEAAYGRILCRPGLLPRTRELLAVAALCAQEQWPQFVAHARGALALGADRGELHEVVYCALGDEQQALERCRRV